jgi:hypothetical protein
MGRRLRSSGILRNQIDMQETEIPPTAAAVLGVAIARRRAEAIDLLAGVVQCAASAMVFTDIGGPRGDWYSGRPSNNAHALRDSRT